MMRAMLRPGMFLAFAAALAACGGDDGGAPEDCSAWPDPEELCPGALTFEAFVSDLETGDATVDVAVSQRGQAGVTTVSAPNGRAVLCLTAGDAEIESQESAYLARRDTLDECAVARVAQVAQPYPINLLTAAFADQLLGQVTRDDSASLLLVTVRSYPDGTPQGGASIALDAEHDGVVAVEGGFLFANVPGAQVALSFMAPDGLDCAGPETVALVPGGVAGALFACE
jgi:hypothetical protein